MKKGSKHITTSPEGGMKKKERNIRCHLAEERRESFKADICLVSIYIDTAWTLLAIQENDPRLKA